MSNLQRLRRRDSVGSWFATDMGERSEESHLSTSKHSHSNPPESILSLGHWVLLSLKLLQSAPKPRSAVYLNDAFQSEVQA